MVADFASAFPSSVRPPSGPDGTARFACPAGVSHSNSMTPRRAEPLRVLLIAEHCNPTWTSVPLVGYQQARALAARQDLAVTLVTHVNNRRALEADPLVKQIPVHFIDNEWLA